ncbi:MAG: Zinc-ribbon domain-containing protein [Cenarchaeum symbiont of Oopsacas minuta]|nr:Zinc-ribbon domain-containing protein [Cenarchaeum symbiont of Oopsacas minuta]
MSLGEVDTLNLLTEKLDSLFTDSQTYYESFLDMNNLYKNGKIGDKEFFSKLGDYVVAYSALEFLSVKVILELKKSIDKIAGGQAPGGTSSPGLMPGMGSPGMMQPQPRMGTSDNPVGGPPGIVSAAQGFNELGTLPSPDPALVPRQQPPANACPSCGSNLRSGAKFCTSCGTKI